jgi:hypothetical protein
MMVNLLFVLLVLLPGAYQDGMVEGKLVFESASHLGTKPGARTDPGFLLSYFAVGPKTKPFKSSGVLFTATKAPNGSALASTDGGSTWQVQHPDVYVGIDSYAAYPASYDATGRPTSYAAYVGPVVYASPAPAGHTYTGHLHYLSADQVYYTGPSTFHSSVGPPVQFQGLPAAAVQFIPGDGNVVRLANGTWLSTVSVWFARDAPQNMTDPNLKCCNVSVTVFASSDEEAGLTWRYVTTVATPAAFRNAGGDEGPNENALVTHPDGQTVTIFLRTAGGEGWPNHHHLPYFVSTSTDGGARYCQCPCTFERSLLAT